MEEFEQMWKSILNILEIILLQFNFQRILPYQLLRAISSRCDFWGIFPHLGEHITAISSSLDARVVDEKIQAKVAGAQARKEQSQDGASSNFSFRM
ncbi:hypothetical protein KY290_025938 [Solanum tuberosum]|uniref:Uncharacterized protein n=1 Tax=Solanum tuberosum TaxID=4113 RepID=A0ABQ7UW65_SOLTU|nr:hypothetical protein KY289_025016 [Solanum tuberosum]KAH0673667.1 hypothetical protein KY284_024754 [Solanum tuberosum]KAH0677000.1 hypothetical protein KY285_024801 [Solanum tuberosum]KAH0755668.1 hypothetical protein KY290_025938 [Solanum tuberosum]